MNFVKTFNDCRPAKGQVALFWFGQAGFMFKTAGGRAVAIDPYFTDYVLHAEKLAGFKRLSPPPCEPDDIVLDYLLISHEHGDHFDQEAIKTLMANGRTQVYTNPVCAARMREMGLDMNRVHVCRKGERIALDEFELLGVDCDHGVLAPEALGFILDFGFTRVYYAGDTAPTWERLSVPMEIKPEVAILPINGAYGNLDGAQAADYAGRLGCRICVPCHFWTFPLHHGDPQQILDAIGESAPNCELRLLCQGEGFLL